MEKYKQVYRLLKHRIVDRTYSPGYRLVISQIAEECGVSTLPVRKALMHLEDEGMVGSKKNSGAFVIGVEPRSFREQIQTIAYLEGIATRLAYEVNASQSYVEASAVNEQMRTASTADTFTSEDFATLNAEFHLALYRHCPNQHLLKLVIKELEQTDMLLVSAYALMPETPFDSVNEHDAILRLLATPDSADEVEFEVRKHRFRTIRLYEHVNAWRNSGNTAKEPFI